MPDYKEEKEQNDGFFIKLTRGAKERYESFKGLSGDEKRRAATEFLLNNAMYIIIITAVIIYIYFK